jgi:tetratricopeptide (TPR) repeat protein
MKSKELSYREIIFRGKTLRKIFFLLTLPAFILLSAGCSSAERTQNRKDQENLKLLEQNVESADSFFIEGKDSFIKNEYGSALESFQKSSYSQALFYIGLTLSELGKKEDAKEVFMDCAAKNILPAESYYNLSMIAYDLGDINLSKEFAIKSIGLKPDHTGALFFAGNLFYVESNMAEALNYYNKAIATDPSSVDLWEAVFSVYLQTEEFEKGWAIRDKIDRNNTGTVLNVLKVAEITGNFKEGADFPKKELLEDSAVNQQVRILLTRAGEIKKAAEMAQKEMEKNKKPYLIIDRMTGDNGSYVIVLKESSVFLVCSAKSEIFIPVEISSGIVKIDGRNSVKSHDVSKEAVSVCSEQK